MPRKQHSHHYIYKTTCSVTNRYYIGMHSTSNLEDGYLGSGQCLWHSINRYGKENHSIEILEFLSDRKSLALREAQIVNEELLKDPMCMNLAKGGEAGGFLNEEHQLKCSSAGGKTMTEHKRQIVSNLMKAFNTSDKHKPWPKAYDWTGKKHSEATKKKMSESKKGKGIGEINSQFGTMWITNGRKNKKIKKDQLIPNGWQRGRVTDK